MLRLITPQETCRRLDIYPVKLTQDAICINVNDASNTKFLVRAQAAVACMQVLSSWMEQGTGIACVFLKENHCKVQKRVQQSLIPCCKMTARTNIASILFHSHGYVVIAVQYMWQHVTIPS